MAHRERDSAERHHRDPRDVSCPASAEESGARRAFTEQRTRELWKTRNFRDIITSANRLSMPDQFSKKVCTKQIHNALGHIASYLPATVDAMALTFPGNAKTPAAVNPSSARSLRILSLAPITIQSFPTHEIRQLDKLGSNYNLPFRSFESL